MRKEKLRTELAQAAQENQAYLESVKKAHIRRIVDERKEAKRLKSGAAPDAQAGDD